MMASRKLEVLIADAPAGVLVQKSSGELQFSYYESYEGLPLTLSMGDLDATYNDPVVRVFIQGLIPEDEQARKKFYARAGVDKGDLTGLLLQVGQECLGAVQFRDTKAKKEAIASTTSLSDEDIAQRIAKLRKDRTSGWAAKNECWILGGSQPKFALRKTGDSWFSCQGVAPTTHIFKVSTAKKNTDLINEFLVLQLAQASGIPAAEVAIETFEKETALVATRFDRVRAADQRIIRLHKTTLGQNLAALPSSKRSLAGGAGVSAIIELLAQSGEPAYSNINTFVRSLMFAYLVGAADINANNFSLLMGKEGAYLSPLYGITSALLTSKKQKDMRIALDIAGENRANKINAKRLRKFIEQNNLETYGLSAVVVASLYVEMAEELPEQARALCVAHEDITGMKEFAATFIPALERQCKTVLEALRA